MQPSEPTADAVRILLSRYCSLPPASLAGDVPLGARGLGLDSIAVMEVLLECQRRFGVDVSRLLDLDTITVQILIDQASAARGR